MEKKKLKSNCPINYALEIFGDKWSLLIIRDIVFNDKHYYGEFLQSGEKISTNILANRLLTLEEYEIICKTVDVRHKSKFVYKLSQKGIDLLPILLECVLWSSKYDKLTSIDPTFIANLKKNKNKVLKETYDKLANDLL